MSQGAHEAVSRRNSDKEGAARAMPDSVSPPQAVVPRAASADAEQPDLRTVPLRNVGRWIAAAVVLFLAFFYLQALVTNVNMHWEVFAHYLFDPSVLRGLLLTIELTAAAMALAIVSGVILAVVRLSSNPVLSWISATYVWFFRGTPLLVQLLFWYFLAALFPKIGLGIPYGPTFVQADTNALIGQFGAAVLALGLHEGAYIAEIDRAGILSVDRGQTEAAQSLGMSHLRILRRIVLPQAMRFIVPPTGNATISMLKTTSVVLLIALPDLLTTVQLIYARNFQQIPLLAVACFWYLLCSTLLSIAQSRLERHYSRGHVGAASGKRRQGSRSARPEKLARVRKFFTTFSAGGVS
jgi:polar amino acid transport system permease protein